MSNKKGVIVYNSNLSEEEAIRRACFDGESVIESALYLRALIVNIQDQFPEDLTAESLNIGQGKTPEALSKFFRVLYTGVTDLSASSDKVERLVQSVSDDVVFTTTRRRIKPGKHLSMPLGIKSLTRSRRVIDILNRFGHCVSYNTAEMLETKLATNIAQRQFATPDGIERKPGLCTSLAWDNYDENSETLSGAGTLHETVGICYQNVEKNTPVVDSLDASIPGTVTKHIVSKRQSSKQAFVPNEITFEPYRKKPKMSSFSYSVKTSQCPSNITQIEYYDIFWMINIALPTVPMWAGWNSQIIEDTLPCQTISYMDSISLPPTRLDVVAETLKVSQKVEMECGQQFCIVHYDLAVAKPALQIQAQETPV